MDIGLTAPLFQGRASANQTLPATPAWTSVPLDLEDYDDLNGHSTTTNNSRWTTPRALRAVKIAGTIVCNAGQATTAGSTARYVRVLKNGGTTLPGAAFFATYAGNYLTVSTPVFFTDLAAGDYIELQAYAGLASAVLFSDGVQSGSILTVSQ